MGNGHDAEKLEEMEPKAVLRTMENANKGIKNSKKQPLVFKTKFFQEVGKLKCVLGGHYVPDRGN